MKNQQLILNSADLVSVCKEMSKETFVTVDTEFVRERTYWPILCLVQLGGTNNAYAVDPLAKDMDLTPLFELMLNPKITKVFHAAKQDLEIFLKLMGKLPAPLADTQVMAMISGHGEQVGYESLVQRIAKQNIDKSNRYTDWSKRPLTNAQLDYAIADVTHLRLIYETLLQEARNKGRESWIEELMADLKKPETYIIEPENAWKRLKPRVDKPKFLGVLTHLAAWREGEAQRRDKIRNHILRDEAINEIAATEPRTKGELARIRGLGENNAKGALGAKILEVVEAGLASADTDPISLPKRPKNDNTSNFVVDLLKVLLKARCDENKVASKLVATSADIDAFVRGDKDAIVLKGWRFEIFGREAQQLLQGGLSLGVNKGNLEIHLPV